MDLGSLPKSLELLQPLAEQGGVVGKEAKELIGRLRIRQQEILATYAPKLLRADGKIDWDGYKRQALCRYLVEKRLGVEYAEGNGGCLLYTSRPH